ncbi:hypothetical protein [Stenotrophomonas maltophilia]|uniref:hypothetical protein n=1 Tax=Stenotrophomonas maltophilia TaxID=40324 RepID=UPI000B408098|nr:hypothetical protein [Stenotrophomonas maltophilia]OWB45336.1 hypothetical protein B7H27_16470 [Stenotrophomonas maltophilia]
MSETFEGSMQEILESMLSVCLEYGENRVDGVYLYGAAEAGTSSADVFYEIGSGIYRIHELNDSTLTRDGQQFDVSDDRGFALLNHLLDDFDRLIELHEGHNREPPTQLKAHFDAVTGKLSLKFSHDLHFTNTEDLLPSDFFEAWLQEVKERTSNANVDG